MDLPAVEMWKSSGAGGSRSLQDARVEEDEGEFAALVERQARFLYRVAYSVVRNAQDAEDVVQEALLKLYRTGAWRGMKEEKAYLARMAWRSAVERLPRREEREAVETELEAAGESPERSAVRGSEEALLRRVMEGLPEEMRRVLVLFAMEEMTSREVAEVTGLPEGTVRRRVMRAKEELKRRYMAAMEVRR